MGLIDDKKNVFTTIGSYVSLIQRTAGKIDEVYNLYPSINNKKDVVPFLLDTLKTTVGTDALKQTVGELFTKVADIAETQIKEVLKKQLTQFNAGASIPTFFQSTGTGIQVPVKDIDTYGKFKTNPNSDVGSLLYGTTENFDSKVYEAITFDGTPVTIFDMLQTTYDSTTDKITLKSVASVPSIGEWMSDYVDKAVIIDKKEFLSNVMNAVYGSATAAQGKSVEEVYKELQVSKLIEQLIEDDDSFEISQDEFDALLQKAQALVDGVIYYDMGCGLMASELPLNDMISLIQQISGATDSFAVGNAVENTIYQSSTDDETIAENKETIRDGFFQKIIRIIQQMLAEIATTSPQIRALMAIIDAFQHDGVVTKIGDAVNDLKNFKVMIKCIIREIMKMINEFIFKLVVSYLISLLAPIIKKIIQEKINQYVGILKSLIT